MANHPAKVVVRSYQVGFGDAFLVSFEYDNGTPARRVLIDLGTTAMPKYRGAPTMKDIARDIHDTCTKTGTRRLDGIVVTHRHKDHISGFSGDPFALIQQAQPGLVVQPWTEDPEIQPDAVAPPAARDGRRLHALALQSMHQVAALALQEVAIKDQRLTASVRSQLAFLGEDNLKNRAAVENLMSLPCPHVYAHYGSDSGLEEILPGVKVHVLGPPTIEQSAAIRKQRATDAAEFWHLQAAVGGSFGDAAARRELFAPEHCWPEERMPPETRWFLSRLDEIRGEELLRLVRVLDDAMNNTSLILLFEVGDKKILFSGDAQIENWSYALKAAPDAGRNRELLADVHFYKVGHHGSLNATPKSLWKLFRHRHRDEEDGERLVTVMSTMGGKHGHARDDTEVPRQTLVRQLKTYTDHLSTQTLRGKRFFEDTTINVN